MSLLTPLWTYSLQCISGRRKDPLAKAWLRLLSTLSRLYGAGVKLQASAGRIRRLPRPVISVGNITAGGTGKTPFVAWLSKQLLNRGIRPVVLLRGYRGMAKGPLVVSDGRAILTEPPLAGDEASLLALKLPGIPVVIGRDRYLAGLLALSLFDPDVLLLDDGFQHRRLHRDLDLVLLDGSNPFGYGSLLPRGLLREPLEALKRADLLAITTDTLRDLQELKAWLYAFHSKPPLLLHRLPKTFLVVGQGREIPLQAVAGKRAVAFSGIGNPSSFEEHLRRLGIELLEHRIFPDHHRYRPRELRALAEGAEKQGAEVLLTTEKDAVKLNLEFSTIPLFALRVGVEVIEGGGELEEALGRVLGKTRSGEGG